MKRNSSGGLNRSVKSVQLWLCSKNRSTGMAVYQGYRAYSTDSVGSDVVFTDESHNYQGMLRAMDERKGTAEILSLNT